MAGFLPAEVIASGAPTSTPPGRFLDLEGGERERLVPLVRACFEGYYRWHAKRTLRDIAHVRAYEVGGDLAGGAMLEHLLPEVGYVFYILVGPPFRGRGIGGRLLDDALLRFRGDGTQVVYAAAEEDNHASLALFRSRGFRIVEKKERSWQEGGLGAWGLRSRMHIVSGEVLLGLDLRPGVPTPPKSALQGSPS